MQYLSNPEIIARLRRGERKALDPIFDTFFASLCYFANKMIDDKMQSQDIVIENFVKVWERRETFEDAKSIKAFLYISVKNSCINHIRSRKSQEKGYKKIAEMVEVVEQDAEQMRIKAEILRMVTQEIPNLPEKCGLIMQLIFRDGLTVQEIANRLGLSPATVRNQKARGLQLMRQSLNKHEWRLFQYVIMLSEILNQHRQN